MQLSRNFHCAKTPAQFADRELSRAQQRILSELIEIAQKSDMQSLHGACIVKNGKICSKGMNSRREYVNGSIVSSMHAEISVLYQFLRRQEGGVKVPVKLDLWVIRLKRDRSGFATAPVLANSEPCRSCFSALIKYGIRRVYFSNDDGQIECIKVNQVECDDFYLTKFQERWGVQTNWILTR
jgi:tRNA(Arg) A34 adenosine deaminase TadA